jgi:hypothetical protein
MLRSGRAENEKRSSVPNEHNVALGSRKFWKGIIRSPNSNKAVVLLIILVLTIISYLTLTRSAAPAPIITVCKTNEELGKIAKEKKTLDINYFNGVQSDPKRKKNLLFTSVGDQSVYRTWMSGRTFDVVMVYYRDDQVIFDDICRQADLAYARKDGKFPNLQFFYKTHPGFLESYDSVIVLDDDMNLTAAQIEKLFEVRARFDLAVLGPSRLDDYTKFKANKQHHPTNQIRYVEFIEMCFPVFKTSKLVQYLDVFDSEIKGWGADIWYSHMFYSESSLSLATYDGIALLNPILRPNQVHEIDTLQSKDDRQFSWESFAVKHGLPPKLPQSIRSPDGFTKVVQVD